MKGWEEPEKKYCKECIKKGEKSSIYRVYGEKVEIRNPEVRDQNGNFKYFLIEMIVEVFVCSNNHFWSELNHF